MDKAEVTADSEKNITNEIKEEIKTDSKPTESNALNDVMRQECDIKTVGDTLVLESNEVLDENLEKSDIDESLKAANNSDEKLVEKEEEIEVDELGLKCNSCKKLSCTMWRKLDKNTVLCNICHLKRIKNATIQNGSITIKNNGNNSTSGRNKDIQAVRISNRKNKAKKKFPSSFISDRTIKNGNSKNRRNIFKKKPLKGVDTGASLVVSSSLFHNGLLYQVGDIICTCDLEEGTYFAQIRGFMQDDYCEKSVVITWLIPLKPNQHTFDPMLFIPGLDEDKPRPMACFDFVCRAPNDLYKSRILHPPLQHSHSNLENLFAAAQTVRE